MLENAVRIQLAEQDETQRDLIFAFTNLGLARMGTGDYVSAESAFRSGLEAAIANKSRMHAPILVDIADLECRTNRFEEGLATVETARPMMAERYPDDPWRVALVDNVKAECLTGQRHFAEADALVTASTPILLKKWTPDKFVRQRRAAARDAAVHGHGRSRTRDQISSFGAVLTVAHPEFCLPLSGKCRKAPTLRRQCGVRVFTRRVANVGP